MNEIQIFENTELGSVRVVKIEGTPYFVGKDVADILGYSNTRKAIGDHVDEEDRVDGVTIRDSIGREQTPILINESGLYSLILSSKLPQAKKFKRWVTSEVLPSVLQTGIYSVNRQADGILTVRDVVVITTEVIKALVPTLLENGTRVTVNNVYTGRRGKHSKVDRLPYPLRHTVEDMLLNDYITFDEVSDFLAGKGYLIAKSSLQRHSARLREEKK